MKNKRGYQKLLAFIKNKEVIKASCIYKNKKGFEKAFLALYAKTKKLFLPLCKNKKAGQRKQILLHEQ